MKTLLVSIAALSAVAFAIPALTNSGADSASQAPKAKDDADVLYGTIKQARAELREMRTLAGLHAHPSGPHIDPAGHHEGESPEAQARERNERDGHEDGGEGRGHEAGGERGHGEGGEEGHGEGGERGHKEGGERGQGEGGERGHQEGGEKGHGDEGGRGHEEGRRGGEEHSEGRGNAKLAKHVKTYKNGALLTLQYNPATQAFVGSVKNTTGKPLSEVRVEIHLSNGVELGPTMRTDVKPGASLDVELSALDQKFTTWVTHPEAGNEEEHSAGDEEAERHGGREAGGEHSEGRESGERGEHGRGEAREGEHGGGEESKGEHGGGEAHEGGHGEGAAASDGRPTSGKLRAVHNQVNLLRGEMRAFKADLKAMKK